jgi:hypothetical protein
MTDTTHVGARGLEHPQYADGYIHVSRDARGRVRFDDPSEPDAWLEADEAVVCEVGVDGC